MIRTEDAREFFKKDVFANKCGIVIDSVTTEEAICSVEINEGHCNADGMIQGGLIFTLADFTFAVMANGIHALTVTQSATITYLAAAKTKKLTAHGIEIAQKGKNCVIQVMVEDTEKNIVAIVMVNGFTRENKQK